MYIDKNITNYKNKFLSERQGSKHSKHSSYKEILLIDRNSKNDRNSEIRKSTTIKSEREDSLYTQLKKNKKINLNDKKLQSSNKKLNNSNHKIKSTKE